MTTDIEAWTAKQREKGEAAVTLKADAQGPGIFGVDILKWRGQTLPVIFGDRWERRTQYACTVWVKPPEGRELRVQVPVDAEFVKGKGRRKVYFPGGVVMGRSSMMGYIAHSLRSGTLSRRI